MRYSSRKLPEWKPLLNSRSSGTEKNIIAAESRQKAIDRMEK
jgi:hypothetical protein